MNRFRGGIFVGIGISLLSALMIALTRSKKLRQEVGKRLKGLRNARPSSEQIKQSAQQAAIQVHKTRTVLGNLIQQSARRVTQRSQQGESLAEPSAQSVEQREQERSEEPERDG